MSIQECRDNLGTVGKMCIRNCILCALPMHPEYESILKLLSPPRSLSVQLGLTKILVDFCETDVEDTCEICLQEVEERLNKHGCRKRKLNGFENHKAVFALEVEKIKQDMIKKRKKLHEGTSSFTPSEQGFAASSSEIFEVEMEIADVATETGMDYLPERSQPTATAMEDVDLDSGSESPQSWSSEILPIFKDSDAEVETDVARTSFGSNGGSSFSGSGSNVSGTSIPDRHTDGLPEGADWGEFLEWVQGKILDYEWSDRVLRDMPNTVQDEMLTEIFGGPEDGLPQDVWGWRNNDETPMAEAGISKNELDLELIHEEMDGSEAQNDDIQETSRDDIMETQNDDIMESPNDDLMETPNDDIIESPNDDIMETPNDEIPGSFREVSHQEGSGDRSETMDESMEISSTDYRNDATISSPDVHATPTSSTGNHGPERPLIGMLSGWTIFDKLGRGIHYILG